MPAVSAAARARATTSSTEASATSMVTTEFCAIGAMTSAMPGLNRLFTMTFIVSRCMPVARPMAVAITASATREASVPVRLEMASMARWAAGELNRACQYRCPAWPCGAGRPAERLRRDVHQLRFPVPHRAAAELAKLRHLLASGNIEHIRVPGVLGRARFVRQQVCQQQQDPSAVGSQMGQHPD